MLLSATLGLATLAAQDYRARIQGAVTDSTQAVVVGATVTLDNVKTGVSTTRQTNEAGLYLFDLVLPGEYRVSIELPGFKRFVQENVLVQSGADVTVNATLSPGQVQEAITVSDIPPQIQFNTTNVGITIDTKLANELPRFDRNPFKLSLLSPSAVNTRTEMNPFHSWAGNSVELGGGTNLKNDLLVDGAPIGVGHKSSYVPPPDAVQEVNVLQNSVDAESGHSAGGVISMTMKSGTNEFHGNLWYLGRNPALNALQDRTNLQPSSARNNMYGFSLGNPIFKNKLFNFGIFEAWKLREPLNYFRRVPTPLERAGDFSQSLNIRGSVRTIYDPFSTEFNPATNAVRRTPFPDNKIPQSRFDPVAAKLNGYFWDPNNPGENITGANNFKTALTRSTDYWNFSDRADWFVNDKWRVSGRFSRLHTNVDSNDPTPNNSPLYVTQGASARHAKQVSGDVIWTATPSTIVNIRGDYHSLVDDYDSPRDQIPADGWSEIWQGNPWYQAYARQDEIPNYWPRFTIGGQQFGIQSVYWYQRPNGTSFSAKVSQQRGTHYWKAGVDWRHSGGVSLVTGTTNFNFVPALTADTFLAPNTQLVGHEYATFLLGALDTSTTAITKPIKKPRTENYAFFLQDDWKIHPRLTLNLGLRYEYESPWYDPEDRFSRFLDLEQPIPEMQANPPQMPAQVGQYYSGPHIYNGAWIFADEDNRGMWDAPLNGIMPRIGMALRVNDRTSLRFGYARYTAPTEFNFIDAPFSGFENINFLEPPMLGFDASQTPQPLLEGIPQAVLSDPFPTDSNPLIPPVGKTNGMYFGLGQQNLLWFYQNARRSINDRFTLSVQRQLPYAFVVDFTAFANFGHELGATRNMNMMDPRLGYQYQGQLNATVANPFYQYLTPDKFPGPLRNQRQVALSTLLRPYPQFGGLYEINTPTRNSRYQSLMMQVNRRFLNGFNMLFGYVYIRDRSHVYYDAVAEYLNEFNYQESTSPRHRISAASTLEIPVGRGRRFGSDMPRWADAMFGGWQTVGAFYYNSGEYLRFGAMQADGNPVLDNPTAAQWFDTSVFRQQPAFTQRSNPWQYSGLTGPNFWDIQGSVSKNFVITERVRTEFKVAGYNLANVLMRANPDLGVTSSNFGKVLRQRGGSTGRQLEYGLKIIF